MSSIGAKSKGKSVNDILSIFTKIFLLQNYLIMSKETIFSKMPPLLNVLLLFGLMILGMLFSLIVIYLINTFFITDLSALSLNGDLTNTFHVFFLKILQFINHTLIFIFPAILFGFLMQKNPFSYLQLKKKVNFLYIIFCIIIVFLYLPIIGVMVEMNDSIKLPSFLSTIEKWMRDSEEQAAILTEAFLNVGSIKNYLFNLFIIALIPAIGEEFIFRGVMQKILTEWIKKPILAILITSFIFSAVHLQFFGFIPRMFLGFILGYMFFYTGNLWVSVILHFINNAFTVTAYFLKNRGLINIESIEDNMANNYFIVFSCLLILVLLLWYIRSKKPVTEGCSITGTNNN